MSNINAASDEKIEPASGLTQPTGNNTIDIKGELQSAGFASRSKPSSVGKDDGPLDIDFCHSSLSTQPAIGNIDTTYDEHTLPSARLASRTKPSNFRIVSQWIVDHQIGI